MRGIAQVVPPSAIVRRLNRIRARTAPVAIVEAKLHAKAGQYREALVLLIEAGGAESEHLEGYDRWAEQQSQSIEDLV